MGCEADSSLTSQRAALSAPGLVAAYAFDEGSGSTVFDATGSGANGTLSGQTWVAGKYGRALSFGGSFVTVAPSARFDLTTAMTLSAWVYPLNHTGYQTVIMKERPGEFTYVLYANGTSSSAPGAGFTSGSPHNERWLDTATVLPTKTWSYLAATYDGTALRVYLNGTLIGSKAETSQIDVTTGAIRFGGNAIWGESFLGSIDEIRIYNRALSASQIVADMGTPIGSGASSGSGGSGGAGGSAGSTAGSSGGTGGSSGGTGGSAAGASGAGGASGGTGGSAGGAGGTSGGAGGSAGGAGGTSGVAGGSAGGASGSGGVGGSAGGVSGSAGTAGAAGPYPLKLASGSRFLVDQAGRPFMIVGDSPWEIVTGTDNAGATTYMDDRRAKGFNTILVELMEHSTTAAFGVATLSGERAFAKALPGSTYPDFSAPNDTYFNHVDEIVQLAASRGIQVLFTVAYLGYQGGGEGWYQEMVANGVQRLTSFGNYVGNRYKNFPNLMWVDGGDYNAPDKSLTRAVANGVKAFDSQHLHTVHAADGTSGLDYWSGEPWLDVDTVYDNFSLTQVGIHTRARTEYTRTGWKPFFLIESCYESGNCGDEILIRQQAYETLLNGGFGQIYGNGQLWPFTAGWLNALNSQGANDMARVKALFGARHWETLVPDTNQTFLTAGAGTGGTFASASSAGDGTFGIVYTPAIRDLTVNMSRFARQVTARWYDPSNGVFSAAASSALPNTGSQTFRPPGNNSRGKPDWVLLLETS